MKLSHFLILCLALIFLLFAIARKNNRYLFITPKPISRYSQLENYILRLPHIKTTIIGKSEQQRNIYACYLNKSNQNKGRRILLISGQHGQEVYSIFGLLDTINYLANKRVGDKIVFIPIANPDGYEINSRFNSKGVDINRDWHDKKSKECRVISNFIKEFKSNLIIDVHWGLKSSVEYCGRGINRCKLHKQIKQETGEDFLIFNSYRKDRKLIHRYYGKQGIPSFIIETPVMEEKKARDIYRKVITSLIDQ
jgi:hypothetical protein